MFVPLNFVGEHHFVVELRMGCLHTYFPTEENWRKSAPPSLTDLWINVKDAAEEWSENNSAAFDVVSDAWIEFVDSD